MKMLVKNIIHSIIVLFLLFLISSCENPLEDRVNDLEDELKEQKENNARQQEILDSLIYELNIQKTEISSIAIERQRLIDSLSLLYGNKLDSLDFEQKKLIDSLNFEQNNYIDSISVYQQSLIESILESQLSSEILNEEFYSGIIPRSWSAIDLSNKTGKEKTLVILRIDRISTEGNYIVFRPNGDTVDWLTTDGFLTNSPSSLSIASLASPLSGYILVFTDENGIVEIKGGSGVQMTASIKLTYYLN